MYRYCFLLAIILGCQMRMPEPIKAQAEYTGHPCATPEPEVLFAPKTVQPVTYPFYKPMKLWIAKQILTVPPKTNFEDYPNFAESTFEEFRQELLEVAIDMQLADPREVWSLFKYASSRQYDLQTIRSRYAELYDVPMIEDACRLPSRDTAVACMSFNRSYGVHLDVMLSMKPAKAEYIKMAKDETARLYLVWDSIGDAQSAYFYITARRSAMKKLRNLIGPEAYCGSHWPPPVPVQYFQRID